MTISSTTSRVSSAGNDVTVDFSFPYLFFANADLVVILVVDATGVETTQVLDTDYTLVGAGDDAGGTVTMTTAPATGESLVIYRSLELTQEVDYISGDAFPAETHEEALDRLTMIAQRTADQINRSMRLSEGSPSSISTELPFPIAGYALVWNDLADALISAQFLSAGDLVVSAFVETMLNDGDAGEVLDTLGVSAFIQTLLDDADASTALATLGAQAVDADTAKTDVVQNYTASQSGEITALTDAANIATDMALSNFFSVTLEGNRTLDNPTNLVPGASGSIFITQDVTGTRTLAYGSYWDFVGGGAAPVASTAGDSVDRLDYLVRTTTSIHAVLTKDWS